MSGSDIASLQRALAQCPFCFVGSPVRTSLRFPAYAIDMQHAVCLKSCGWLPNAKDSSRMVKNKEYF
jgi:hypothetical protein